MRILFFAEAVTLAHVARPIVLANAALENGHSVALARAPSYAWLTSHYAIDTFDLPSISPNAFAKALARGTPVFSASVLESYVSDDLALIDRFKPDVIVGDFRLSLSVSARLAGIPYATITNAYWSPYASPTYTVPSLPLTRILPISIANRLFQAALPLVFPFHCRPLNQVRRNHGLASLGTDLRNTYTDADAVLYADIPETLALPRAPENHHFLGPILWSPPIPYPDWWHTLPDHPIVYATPGSSGHARLLPMVIEALSDLPLSLLVSSAGSADSIPRKPNIFSAEYLPGTECAARASLVICNGGSPTCQQAYAAGVPVLAIPSNLDQYLNVGPLAGMGAAEVVRADRATPSAIREASMRLLQSESAKTAASHIASLYKQYNATERFLGALPSLSQPYK